MRRNILRRNILRRNILRLYKNFDYPTNYLKETIVGWVNIAELIGD